MKKINGLSLLLYSLFFFNTYAHSQTTASQLPAGAFWVSNHWCENKTCAQEPVRWRHSLSTPKSKMAINSKGLDHLYSSGSAAPSLSNMIWLKKTYGIDHPIYLIDLRQETHLNVNGLPVSIFYKKNQISWGKTPAQIDASEQAWSKQIPVDGKLSINKLSLSKSGFKEPSDPTPLTVKSVYTQAQTADIAGLSYYRIYVPDYQPPAPGQVDYFLKIIQALPQNAWLHFHCAAGKGRTTTFMVMRDILANAKEVSLNDIVMRQAKLGGIKLLGKANTQGIYPWKIPYRIARQDFIKLFYDYVHSGAYPNQRFTAWMTKQTDGPYKLVLHTPAYNGLT